MCCESSDVVRIDLGPLLMLCYVMYLYSAQYLHILQDSALFNLQGQTRIAKLKSAYNSLIIDPRGLGWYTNI